VTAPLSPPLLSPYTICTVFKYPLPLVLPRLWAIYRHEAHHHVLLLLIPQIGRLTNSDCFHPSSPYCSAFSTGTNWICRRVRIASRAGALACSSAVYNCLTSDTTLLEIGSCGYTCRSVSVLVPDSTEAVFVKWE